MTPAIAGPLGSLAFSCVAPHAAAAALRAVKWHRDLERLGVVLPFFVVHDLGLAFVSGPEQLRLGARAPVDVALQHDAYRELVTAARASETARRAAQLAMSDDLVVVVLARTLGDVARAIAAAPAYRAELPLDATLFEGLTAERLAELRDACDRGFEAGALAALGRHRLLALTLIDALDLDTLRLFGIAGVSEIGALAQLELLDSLSAPEANDVVNFSLEILPSVLETKTRPAAASFAASGYAGLGRLGSIDNLVLTELAWDDDELGRRLLDDEALYYAREEQHEELAREHWLLIDASASMRGERATFARAMALTTGKKLLLEREAVSYRFFDARLYEPRAARGGALPTPYLLGFKGERGRNPTKVFGELAALLALRRRPEPLVVHLYTHAALYIPRELVAAVKQRAHLTAVFMLPSATRSAAGGADAQGSALDLDYLDLLDGYAVVDHSALGHGQGRAAAARAILAREVVP